LRTALLREQALTTKLSLETDTIGEYVTLYQQQRAALQSRVAAKDDYIRRCTLEIGTLTQRVADLQAVVTSLHTPAPSANVSVLPVDGVEAEDEPENVLAGPRLQELMAPVGEQREWWVQGCPCCQGPAVRI
jgi:hypothetical protein